MLNTIRGNDFKFTVASNISLRSLKSGKDIYYIGGTEVLPRPAGATRGGRGHKRILTKQPVGFRKENADRAKSATCRIHC